MNNLTIHDIDQVLLRLEEDHKAIQDDMTLNGITTEHSRLDLRDAERNLETVQTLRELFLQTRNEVPVPRIQLHKTFGLGFGKHSRHVALAALSVAATFGIAFGTVGVASTLLKTKQSPARYAKPSLVVSVPSQDAAILLIPNDNARKMTSF